MGPTRNKLIKAFIREATEDESFELVADVATVYATLRTLQRGKFTATTENGTTLVSSQVGDEAFTFSVPGVLSAEGIVAIAEEALELIEGLATVDRIRQLLRRKKNSRPDFSGLTW